MDRRLILVINPGSTSTKFAIYAEKELVFEKSLHHAPEELSPYKKITDQFSFRKDLILRELEKRNVNPGNIQVVVGRGGLIKPIESGVYVVNDRMKSDLVNSPLGEHASNLGGLIADDIASNLPHASAYIVDPVVVDELQPVARISGHPDLDRMSIFHALNQKAVARNYAQAEGCRYEDLNLIIAHMGGGISVGAHCKGRVIDVNNAFGGDGPFSPERAGGLPSNQLADLCFSGKYSKEEIKAMLIGKGGMVAYLGTNNFRKVCAMADSGNDKAILIRDAVAYQVSKEIGSMAAVLKGKVDAVILTGGLAFEESHNQRIKDMVGYIGKIVVYPGEDELSSLAFNGLLAMDGQVEIKEYS